MGTRDKEWPQILAIIVACIPGLTSALLFSWPSPFILVLIQDKEHYDISEDEANLLPVLLPIGVTVSAIFFFKIHDIIGRKYTLIVISIPQALFWIITIFAKDIYTFYIARVLSGVGDAMVYGTVPIYIGEIATPSIRGTWGSGQTFAYNAGFLLINVIGKYCNIQQTSYICLIFPVSFVIIFIWMPETPHYYVMKGQDDKAKASLRWLLRKDNIETDFLQLKSDRHVWKKKVDVDFFFRMFHAVIMRGHLFLYKRVPSFY
ncbi:hypothetical protein GWI33_001099 [Rhynchophorus ferrugineus]|uniref:Major facilitator superfamily (MFS) profile domain-containing protein n=1 Tax=Rhynchophorus ferrugineus TaxID=354439 RepID=A0A834HSI6_RHYFE|nr:hypothetical protein GWI33_001099 [Rhynchophorus ferrugineus]